MLLKVCTLYFKGIVNEIDSLPPIPCFLNDHDVKTAGAILNSFSSKVEEGSPDQMSLLSPIHRKCWLAKSHSPAGLHFDKNQDISIQGDKVELPSRGPIVAFQNPVSLGEEKLGGDPRQARLHRQLHRSLEQAVPGRAFGRP